MAKLKGITRSDFLNLKFPVLAYCSTNRGPSTKYNESFHIENKETGITLNFYWDNENRVSVGKFDKNATLDKHKNQTLLHWQATFTQQTIEELCNLHLK